MKVYFFPGQGSQKKGMGGNLFDEYKEHTEKADAILGYSIKELCLKDPKQQLSITEFTQPALFMVSALSYLKKMENDPTPPDFIAGHSLGEYSALFVAGAFRFEDGLRLVKKRGELMSRTSAGSMAAVIGCDIEQIKEIIKNNDLTKIDIANINSPSQIVLAGPVEDMHRAEKIFLKKKTNYIPLNVSAPFHSRYMQPVMEEFSQFLTQFEYADLKIPVISNVHARPYKAGDIVDNLRDQICGTVQWTDTVRYLIGLGQFDFEEIGPGNVLTKLVDNIVSISTPLTVQELTEDDKCQSPEKTEVLVMKAQQPISIEANATDFNGACLGSSEFRNDYNIRYAYLSGSMYKGIASKELVVQMGKAGLMGFLGTGGLRLERIEEDIQYIQRELSNGEAYGMNLLHLPNMPHIEMQMVDLYLKYGVSCIEASAFMQITPALVKYRLQGLMKNDQGEVVTKNKIIAKLSRPEVATMFLSPAPEKIIKQLLSENQITQEAAELSQAVAMADDLCAEADSGGHTDSAVMTVLLPTIIRLKNRLCTQYQYKRNIRVGAAGGIGSPEAAAAAFILGADFVVTGSINQCTVEAGTSNQVKDMLQQINIQDTSYAPAGDMFEIGAKVQVMKRGVFFPARANKLYDLWRQFDSFSEIDEKNPKPN